MTVNIETTPENTVSPEKADTKLSQQNVEASASQQNSENKASNEQDENPNWRAFREARKKDRAEREAAERRASEKEAEVNALKAAMEAAFAKGVNPAIQTKSYDAYQQEELTEDERIERKVQAAIVQREAASERLRLEREQQEYPQRLAQTYPDFNDTIASDNLDYLDFHYPEVAGPLKKLPDGFDKWADIYRAVRKFVPNATSAKKEAARADANFNKPKSMSTTGVTQASEAMGSAKLNEDRKAANWERMQKMLKSLG